jgi:uncharacterized protein YqeY
MQSTLTPMLAVSTTLLTRLRDDLKQAMRTKDKSRATLLKSVLAEVTYAEKNAASAQAAQQALEDNGVIATLQRAIKKRREAADAYAAGNRTDLAEKELAEIETLSAYLPRQWTPDEIRQEVERAVAEVGATSVKDMGKVMRAIRIPAGSASKQAIAETTKAVLTAA